MSQRYQNQAQQAKQRYQARYVPAGCDRSSIELKLFELSSEISSRSTGVGVHKISRPYCSQEVAGFGKMFALILSGKERGVSAGSWSTPGSDFPARREYLKRPAGINPLYGAEGDSVRSKKIYKANRFGIEFNSGIVETHPATKTNKCSCGQALNQGPNPQIEEGLNQGKCQHKPNQHGYGPAKLRSKDLHFHNDSLAAGVFA